jgi:hypothetical protein
MAKPYVDIWLTTRQSVADLIHSFSVMVLMTDLSTLMQPGNVERAARPRGDVQHAARQPGHLRRQQEHRGLQERLGVNWPGCTSCRRRRRSTWRRSRASRW